MIRYLIGVDEAGRGPLAGPVAVGVVVAPVGFDQNRLAGIKDSKKLSAPLRDRWFAKLRVLCKERRLSYTVAFSSNLHIDRFGIQTAVFRALRRALRRMQIVEDECLVLLDGGLRAPKTFVMQRTIIRGDEKERLISLASVAAKVTRDRRMVALSHKYPGYDFEMHKGYGTKEHYRKLRRHGLSPIHRRSFLHGVKIPAHRPR